MKRLRSGVAILLLVGVAGCAEERSFDDLDRYMQAIEARPPSKLTPLPVLELPDVPTVEQIEALRDPFVPLDGL